jgi:hypothetical protein
MSATLEIVPSVLDASAEPGRSEDAQSAGSSRSNRAPALAAWPAALRQPASPATLAPRPTLN